MLDKKAVKSLCEADDVLQWWAMVLFAEIAELLRANEFGYGGEKNAAAIYPLVLGKVKEFSQLALKRQIERANAPGSNQTIAERLTQLEEKVARLTQHTPAEEG